MYFHDFSVKNYLILYAKQSKLGVLRNLRRRKHRSQTPKNSDPWAYWKHRPPKKLRPPGCIENTDLLKISDPLGVSKTQTSRETQIPGCIENTDLPKNSDPLGVSKTQTSRETQTPECIENTDPPQKTQSPWVYGKHRPPGCIENSDPPGVSKTPTPEKLGALDVSKTQTPEKFRPPKNVSKCLDVSKNSYCKFNIFQIL